MSFLTSSIDGAEDFLIICGLVLTQLVYGSFSVFMGKLLAMGLDPLFIVITGSLVTAILLSPFAFFMERGKRPSKLSLRLLIQFFFIAVGGVTVFQVLLLVGIKKTSPAIASAMPNLAPGLIFVIAGFLRLEKVDLKCRYSWAKIMGTLICLGGAVGMSFLQHGAPATGLAGDDGLVGCMYLLTAVFVLSCVMILQAATLMHYPAHLSLVAITSLMGSIFTAVFQLVKEHKLDVGDSNLTPLYLLGLAMVGGLVNGVCFSIQTWSVKKRGPVMVSMFSPVGTVCSAVLSSLILGDSLRLGSICGMALIFVGLYFVLWAKRKEGYSLPEDDETFLLESQQQAKPLLS
ncbi:WAT1-related protein [Nymphaea thermarum]|nr:WAT1-related protein [Nymphaea thermarum]